MSEFRKDLVSGDWIIMAPERAKRPHLLIQKKQKRKPTPKAACPFEDPEKTGNWPPILSYPNDKQWQIILIQNKFPALRHLRACTPLYRYGPHEYMAGIGHHDLLITRDHTKNFADLSKAQATQALQMLQARYRLIVKDKCLVYVSSFFNWGVSAGASIYHPHYQVVALPIIPPEVEHSLEGSKRYYNKYRRCVHCAMLAFETKETHRVFAKNAHAIALVHYASQQPFEVRIYPTRHVPYFERTSQESLHGIAALLQKVLLAMRKRLNDPDLNFYIHTAPLKQQRRYRHYHWHIEVRPKIAIPAGFELSTGIIINVVEPNQAVKLLQGKL